MGSSAKRTAVQCCNVAPVTRRKRCTNSRVGSADAEPINGVLGKTDAKDSEGNHSHPTANSGHVLGQQHGTMHIIMRYEHDALIPATLHSRYKRFLGDVRLENGESALTTIHVPNTGPMTGLLDALPSRVMLSKSENPSRKYKYTLEWIEDCSNGEWVGIHSAKANAMVASMLDGTILRHHLPEYTGFRKEVKYGQGTRLDFQLEVPDGTKPCLVEVKSVTMVMSAPDPRHHESSATAERRIAVFPDTKSERAQKHVKELIQARESGYETALIFVIQRGDCSSFAPCFAKDPEYARLLYQAHKEGVRIIPVACELLDDGATKVVGTTGHVLPLEDVSSWCDN